MGPVLQKNPIARDIHCEGKQLPVTMKYFVAALVFLAALVAAEPEAQPEADAEADAYYGRYFGGYSYGYGLGRYGYGLGGYYGCGYPRYEAYGYRYKRSADADPALIAPYHLGY